MQKTIKGEWSYRDIEKVTYAASNKLIRIYHNDKDIPRYLFIQHLSSYTQFTVKEREYVKLECMVMDMEGLLSDK